MLRFSTKFCYICSAISWMLFSNHTKVTSSLIGLRFLTINLTTQNVQTLSTGLESEVICQKTTPLITSFVSLSALFSSPLHHVICWLEIKAQQDFLNGLSKHIWVLSLKIRTYTFNKFQKLFLSISTSVTFNLSMCRNVILP